MAMWKNDDEMFALMKEKLYTPVVGDILDQMGYKHQFLPASIRPLAAQVPTAPYILPGETEDKRLKVAGYACTVLENDVFEYPEDKPFGYMTEAQRDLHCHRCAQQRPVGRAAHRLRQGPRRCGRCAGRLYPRYPQGH